MSKIWFGLHLPNYTFPDRPPEQLFDAIVEQAKAAEAAGFGLVTVMDHLNQIPGIGQQDEPMLEAWSALAALARETKKVRLGTLVTGVTYRNPALLAKTATTLDVISGGRAIFGIGAAWFEAEHDAFGFEFPPIKERMDRLDEALAIAQGDVHPGPVDVRGPPLPGDQHPQRPAAGPAGRPADPRRRRRRAADAQDRRQARRHDALVPARSRGAPAQDGRPARHCEAIGRDPATIERTMATPVVVDPQRRRARRRCSPGSPRTGGRTSIAGGIEAVRRRRSSRTSTPGFTGFTFNNTLYRTPEQIALVGELLKLLAVPAPA